MEAFLGFLKNTFFLYTVIVLLLGGYLGLKFFGNENGVQTIVLDGYEDKFYIDEILYRSNMDYMIYTKSNGERGLKIVK